MTVRDNLAFPLRNRGLPAAQVAERVQAVARMIGPGGHARPPGARGLTADAKQKISLGRGMVRQDVNAILFDEPLTVIDPHMKWELRTQLKALHREFGHTMIYVTHDQTEALTFADRVVVMHEGRVVQIGTPQELFETPAHTFVGYFIGSPGMNLLPTRGSRATARGSATAARCRSGAATARSAGRVEIGIRPEFVAPLRRRGPARHRSAGSRTWAATASSAPTLGGQPAQRRRGRGRARCPPARRASTFDPAQVDVYADDWRVAGEGPPDGQDPSTTAPGSWSCRCWCWWPSRP